MKKSAIGERFARYLFQLGYRDAYIIPPKQMTKLYPEPPYFFSEEGLSAYLICYNSRVSAVFPDRKSRCFGIRPAGILNTTWK